MVRNTRSIASRSPHWARTTQRTSSSVPRIRYNPKRESDRRKFGSGGILRADGPSRQAARRHAALPECRTSRTTGQPPSPTRTAYTGIAAFLHAAVAEVRGEMRQGSLYVDRGIKLHDLRRECPRPYI